MPKCYQFLIRLTKPFCALSLLTVLSVLLVLAKQTQAQSLEDALDGAGLAWESSGPIAPWFGQTDITHDGVDAGASGTIGHGEGSLLQSSVVGPAAIGFWWKVSSEFNYDFLHFYIDDNEQEKISGEWGWEFRSFQVPSGNHVLRWLYSTDNRVLGGLNRAWLDQVVLAQAPIIISQSDDQFVEASYNAQFQVTAIGAGTLGYQWLLNGTNLSGATTSSLHLANVQPANSGAYAVIVSNTYGSVTSAVARLTIFHFGEALETTGLAWTSSGDGRWTVQNTTTHDGVDAAESAALDYNPFGDQFSVLETQSTNAGIVTFWWKVSSLANWDSLIFETSNMERARISGEVDWQEQTFPVAANEAMRWIYYRRVQPPARQNRGWLDQVSFTPVFAPLVQTSPQGGIFPANTTPQLSVLAIGAVPLHYQWFFNNNPLPGQTNATHTLTAAQAGDSGSYFAVVSNSCGSVTSAVAEVTVYAFGDAVEAPSLIWATNGSAGWMPEFNVAHDGVDSLRSATINANEFAVLETFSTVPSRVSFWWKVSSETNADILLFEILSVGGGSISEHAEISGEVEWEQVTFIVPPGDQVLRWTYAKNESASAGSDAGWLDQMSLTPLTVPVIVTQPQSQSLPTGADVTLGVVAYGAEPISYQWQVEEQNLADATNSFLAFTFIQPTNAGSYTVVISNGFGVVTSAVAQLSVISVDDSLDNRSFLWRQTADLQIPDFTYPWRVDVATAHDGIDAAVAGPLTGGGAALETDVVGPGLLTFWWKVTSADCCELFSFFVGSNRVAQITGEVDWAKQVVPVPAGAQVLRWQYADLIEGIPWSDDRAWLDEVAFTPGAAFIFNARVDTSHFAANVITIVENSRLVVESSTNLLDWTPFQTDVVNGASFKLVLPWNSTEPCRYFRTRAP